MNFSIISSVSILEYSFLKIFKRSLFVSFFEGFLQQILYSLGISFQIFVNKVLYSYIKRELSRAGISLVFVKQSLQCTSMPTYILYICTSNKSYFQIEFNSLSLANLWSPFLFLGRVGHYSDLKSVLARNKIHWYSPRLKHGPLQTWVKQMYL